MTTPYTTPATTMNTAADRVANQDINDYSRNMYGTAFSELTAAQREDVAAAMRSDQRAATGGTIPADSEAATATRLANRALRAADREAVRDRDDYAMATYGTTFSNLTAAQMEDVSNYMRDDEKRTYGTVIAGGEAAMAKRQADLAYAATPAAAAAGTTYLPTQAGVTAPTGTTTTGIVYDTTTATTTTTYDATYGTRPL